MDTGTQDLATVLVDAIRRSTRGRIFATQSICTEEVQTKM